MVIISCLKLKTIRKERIPQSSGGEENEGSDSVGGNDVMETARGSAGNSKKRALRSSTYEVSPGNAENTCEYFPILSFGTDTWGWLQWLGEGSLCWLCSQEMAAKLEKPPGLAQCSPCLAMGTDSSGGLTQTFSQAPSAGIRFPC